MSTHRPSNGWQSQRGNNSSTFTSSRGNLDNNNNRNKYYGSKRKRGAKTIILRSEMAYTEKPAGNCGDNTHDKSKKRRREKRKQLIHQADGALSRRGRGNRKHHLFGRSRSNLVPRPRSRTTAVLNKNGVNMENNNHTDNKNTENGKARSRTESDDMVNSAEGEEEDEEDIQTILKSLVQSLNSGFDTPSSANITMVSNETDSQWNLPDTKMSHQYMDNIARTDDWQCTASANGNVMMRRQEGIKVLEHIASHYGIKIQILD